MIWVLMTAMPPTKGHLGLIQFASEYGFATGQTVSVIVCTQPDEPFSRERFAAVQDAAAGLQNVRVREFHKQIEQNPDAPGFWQMWQAILTNYGALPGDTYVASEVYGKAVAIAMGGKFMPYDPEREIYPCKATNVRRHMDLNWHDMIPEFARYLTQRVTIFGAESTGKTTLAKKLADLQDWRYVFEYARPYLENTQNVITMQSMTDIWKGQRAVQEASRLWEPSPYIVQDTDLFSTVGYWEFPHWQETLGPVPNRLINDAQNLKSDIYLITPSNIPFEKDPLRYGGDVREGSDEYWINIAEKYQLNYRVLKSNDPHERHDEAIDILEDHFYSVPDIALLREYDRKGY